MLSVDRNRFVTQSLLIGAGMAFAAAWQPGPLQAFLLSRIAAGGWRRTLPAALAPLISDGPILAVVFLVLRTVPAGMEAALQATGAVVLIYFGFASYREWRRAARGQVPQAGSAPRTLGQAVLVNFVNPGPWLGWSLILGPLVIEAWHRNTGDAIALVAAFYVTLTVNLALFILLLGATGFLGARGRRRLQLVSAVVLVVLGCWRLLTLLI